MPSTSPGPPSLLHKEHATLSSLPTALFSPCAQTLSQANWPPPSRQRPPQIAAVLRCVELAGGVPPDRLVLLFLPVPTVRAGRPAIAVVVAFFSASAVGVRSPPRRRPASPALPGHSIVLRVSVRTSPPPFALSLSPSTVPAPWTFSAAATARRRRVSGDLMVQPAAPPCSTPSPLPSATLPRVQFRTESTDF